MRSSLNKNVSIDREIEYNTSTYSYMGCSGLCSQWSLAGFVLQWLISHSMWYSVIVGVGASVSVTVNVSESVGVSVIGCERGCLCMVRSCVVL